MATRTGRRFAGRPWAGVDSNHRATDYEEPSGSRSRVSLNPRRQSAVTTYTEATTAPHRDRVRLLVDLEAQEAHAAASLPTEP